MNFFLVVHPSLHYILLQNKNRINRCTENVHLERRQGSSGHWFTETIKFWVKIAKEVRWLVLLDVPLLVPGKLSLDPCPWKSLDVHAGIVSSLLCSVTAGEGGPGAVPFFGVSQFLYPISCWHWFWSQGTTSGAGQSFVDRLCGFFGHEIPSETWQASGLLVQAGSYVGNPCPLVLIKYPGMKATVFCCVYLPPLSLKQWRCSLAGT